ncbi:MAG: flagellar basal body-associated FliL family protein [Opitutales bacterium]
MSDENVEELPAAESKGPNPLIPVIAIVVLLPVINFLMTKFLLIPSMQGALAQTIEESGIADQGEEGAAEVAEAAAEPAAEGEGLGGGTYEFDGIIANLAGAMRSRYVKVSFMVEGSDPEFTATIEKFKPKLVDATIGVLSALSIQDLEDAGVKNVLRNDLMGAFENVMRKRLVEGLYFSEFVVQ